MRLLSTREWILVGIMLFLIIIVGGSWGIQRFNLSSGTLINEWLNYKKRQKELLNFRQKQLAQINHLERDWLKVNRLRRTPTMSQSLNAFIENGTRRFNVQNNLQLNALSSVAEGIEGIQVRLDRLNLDQLFDILFFLENRRPVILIDQLDIRTLPSSDLLRLTFRIYKQKKQ